MRADPERCGLGNPDGRVSAVDQRGATQRVPGMQVVAAVDVDIAGGRRGPRSSHTARRPTGSDAVSGPTARQVDRVDRRLERASGADRTQADELDRCVAARSSPGRSAARTRRWNVVDERVRSTSSSSGPPGSGTGISHFCRLKRRSASNVDLAICLGDAVGGEVVEHAFAELVRPPSRSAVGSTGNCAQHGLEPLAPDVGGGGAERGQHRRELRDEHSRRAERGRDARV